MPTEITANLDVLLNAALALGFPWIFQYIKEKLGWSGKTALNALFLIALALSGFIAFSTGNLSVPAGDLAALNFGLPFADWMPALLVVVKDYVAALFGGAGLILAAATYIYRQYLKSEPAG